MDIVDSQTRSKMMSGIGPKDTLPELRIRKLLHKMGFRFRLHQKNLPGKPDIVLPRHGAVIQIHGCFWHRHLCYLFKWPETRVEFWKRKLNATAERDRRNQSKLRKKGWKSLIVWECALTGQQRIPDEELSQMLRAWLINDPLDAEISGRFPHI